MYDKFTHVHENAIYEIGNYSVAGSFLFASESDIKKMKQKMDHHFSGLCDVICYGFDHEEFRLLIKMKSREEIELYCRLRYPKIIERLGFIPHTAYIFAKAMADLQSGFVKWINYKYDRSGSLMAARYYRRLIESHEELQNKIKEINGMTLQFQKVMIWRYKQKMGFRFRSLGAHATSKGEYGAGRKLSSSMKVFKMSHLAIVQGQFKNLPPKRIIWKNDNEKYQNLVGFILLSGK